MEGSGLAVGLSEAARAQLEHFGQLADLAGIDLLVSDAVSGLFIACNESAHVRLGYTKAELLTLSPEVLAESAGGLRDHPAAGGSAGAGRAPVAAARQHRQPHRLDEPLGDSG